MSFLAIDVGNTRMKWAIFNRAGAGADILFQGVEFLENIDRLADGAWAGIPAPQCMLGCVVSGDAVRRRVELQIRECWDIPPRWVVPGASEAGVINGYDHPARLGADRWVAMIGARQRLLAQGQRRPLLIVMAGTAVTADALDAQGRFLGGIIMPGYGIMLRSVESGTAGLHVPTGEVEPFPSNTSDALASGAVYALSGGIERMLHNLTQHAGEPPVCIMTGGAGWKIRPFFLHPFDLVETLLFDGLLEIAAHRNKIVQG